MVTAISRALTEWARRRRRPRRRARPAQASAACAPAATSSRSTTAPAATTTSARAFWWDEYRMNAHIARYPKPFVSLMDGIVMGGGVGVSAHGSVRVVTDTTKMAMPEVGIGFIPDVGGTYLLSRAPGAARPARRADGRTVRRGRRDRDGLRRPLRRLTTSWPTFTRRDRRRRHRCRPGRPRHRAPAERALAQRRWIDECYAGETVEDIVARATRPRRGPGANDAANLIMTRSPIALSVALEAVRRAAQARHPGRRAAPGISDFVRLAALATTSSKASARR